MSLVLSELTKTCLVTMAICKDGCSVEYRCTDVNGFDTAVVTLTSDELSKRITSKTWDVIFTKADVKSIYFKSTSVEYMSQTTATPCIAVETLCDRQIKTGVANAVLTHASFRDMKHPWDFLITKDRLVIVFCDSRDRGYVNDELAKFKRTCDDTLEVKE